MSPIRMERLESGVRTIIAFTEAFNRHDLPAMMQLIREDCIFESSVSTSAEEILQGQLAISQYWQDFFTSFPEAHIKIEDTFGFGMRCICRWSCDRIDRSGFSSRQRGVDLFRIQDGLIT